MTKLTTWTKEIIAKEAKTYETRIEFKKGSYRAYLAAMKNGISNEICSHMEDAIAWIEDPCQRQLIKPISERYL